MKSQFGKVYRVSVAPRRFLRSRPVDVWATSKGGKSVRHITAHMHSVGSDDVCGSEPVDRAAEGGRTTAGGDGDDRGDDGDTTGVDGAAGSGRISAGGGGDDGDDDGGAGGLDGAAGIGRTFAGADGDDGGDNGGAGELNGAAGSDRTSAGGDGDGDGDDGGAGGLDGAAGSGRISAGADCDDGGDDGGAGGLDGAVRSGRTSAGGGSDDRVGGDDLWVEREGDSVEPIAVRLTVSLRPRKAVCTTGAPPPTSALAAPTPASTNSSMPSNSRGGVASDGSSMSSPRESHTQQHCGSPPRLVAQRQGHTQRAAASASASVSDVDDAAQRQGQEHAGGRGVWSDIALEGAAKSLGGGGGQERGGRSWVGHRRGACHGSVYVGPIRLPQGQRHTLRNLHRGAPRLNASPEHIYRMHGQHT